MHRAGGIIRWFMASVVGCAAWSAAAQVPRPIRPPIIRRPPIPATTNPVKRLAPGQHASPEQVEAAITAAQQYLLSQQLADGSWGQGIPPANQVGGPTALVTYALLCSGLPSTEPHVAKALAYLQSVPMTGTYALGLRAQVWYQLSLEFDPDKPSPDRARLATLIDNDLRLLLKGVNRAGNAAGMYTYLVNNPMGAYDHSCANYGAMGVWACAQTGAEVPQSYWAMVDKGWKSHQQPDGSWGYQMRIGNAAGTASMTAGGLVNLFICQEFLDPNKNAECQGNAQHPNIDAAIQWLGQNLRAQGAMGYTLFNLQRDGFESGLVQFGDYDWYTEGADGLVRSQTPNGPWPGGNGGTEVNTAFCLAFLALGRAPAVLNKLQYENALAAGGNGGGAAFGKDKFGHWAQRPRDAANITRWIEKRLHKRLNWQVVNLAMPMEILHQSPILYISGNQKLAFTPEQLDTLRRYVLEGGMVVGNPDCGSKEFADSFKQLGESLFPDYAFRPLSASHPIYEDELFPAAADKKLPALSALGNQAREFFILFGADDPGRAWQLLPQTLHNGIGAVGSALPKDELYHLAGNLYYYSTERGLLRDKKKTWILPEQPPADKKLTVARLAYDGNWDPEPFGWDQMRQYLRGTQQLELDMPRVHLGSGELDIAKYNIAYLTGTAAMELTDKQRQELKQFAYEGGVLIVDAAGGSPAFVKSAEEELQKAFGRDLEVVPPGHPVFTIAADCSTVKYRDKAKKTLGAAFDKPLLKQIDEGGRVRVFFSPLDLSVALVGQPIDAINGYSPESAMPLMMNMLMFAMQQH